ncbi:MAG: cupin-like domain-containing protein [Bacteroidetes bacterium]|nr:cupin-like domain-containing protein [Bacteroidota bacterium]
MHLKSIERIAQIAPEDFRSKYLLPQRPVILTELSKDWPARRKWDWDYLKKSFGKTQVGVHSNRLAGARMSSTAAADTMCFCDFIDLIRQGPVALRVFRLNFQKLAPDMLRDFAYPDLFPLPFQKQASFLFAGAEGAIAQMHFDSDQAPIFHTQFLGRKRVLLLPPNQSALIYQLPFSEESAASFSGWEYELDEKNYPALSVAKGYEAILNHGDTLFIPSAYWHHMQYMESGIALSLTAKPGIVSLQLKSLYRQNLLQPMNQMMMHLAPEWWFEKKQKMALIQARKAMK